MPLFDTPFIAAPMAGGTSTTALVRAVQEGGGLGFLAAGYKSTQAMAAEIAAARSEGLRFGMNVFVPDPGQLHPGPAVLAQLEAYRAELQPDAARYSVTLPPLRLDDDDAWQEKIDALLADPVEYVSFAFGLPGTSVVKALQKAGSVVITSVTTVEEARAAAEEGPDALAVQHSSAGGHTTAFLPRAAGSATAPGTTAALLTQVRSAVDLPLIAAGAITDGEALREALAAGASAVQVGTALVRTDESGARQTHKDALGDAQFRETAMTRAFTGRLARSLVNDFVRDHANAPVGYPAIHHLTAPVRAAASAAGDPHRLNLWAGTGWRTARTGSATDVVKDFLGGA
ncbi:nitronate monooxygenase [Paenarthrobacter ureafaciens]|jgi:nitronate monooxygenase|uniref:nitronate monooxygenase n=1 Tax=Paenarthrobacter ureafaciens TaxID=37931 RepID=UPI00140E910A|nr:nitronate monooxygenase [Paenarthrobacter ureafaciens]MCX8453335.1 nitronate monooxygenase [Paenarthrobacter ureafaciens]MCY0972916.1 nitronate monooxygenase [Paenarthrobacter ureafaciens]